MTVKKYFTVQSWTTGIAVCAVVLALAASMLSQTGQRGNRITEELTSGAMVRMAGTVHPLTRWATDLGALNSGTQMNSLTLNIKMSAAQQAELDALLAAQQDPKSAQYHQWLTQEEFGARFGLTAADLGLVTRWLESQGFTVRGASKSRNAVYFSGRAWQVESAFHTQLHKYKLNGETHFANATELQVPAGLANILLTVRGLNSFRPKPQGRGRLSPQFTLDAYDHYLSPADWATIYDVNTIYNTGYTGAGAYVGIVGQTYAPPADILSFRSAAGLSTPNIINPSGYTSNAAQNCSASPTAQVCYVCIDPTVANCTGTQAVSASGDLGEADLDLEWSGGIARDATVVFVYAPYEDVDSAIDSVTGQYYDVMDALQRAVQDITMPSTGKVLPVLSMSYGYCEAEIIGDTGSSGLVTVVGQQASSQGQSIVVSSGDSGAAGCDPQGFASTASSGEYVNVPVGSPFYTAVGGTTLNGDESNPSAYWNQTVDLVNSALGYIPETAWNFTLADGALSASGGGVSQIFGQPSWQNGLIAGQTTFRMVPDVAFAAASEHDGYLVCSSDFNGYGYGTSCANGFFTSSDYILPIGGTSASAPSFAGMLTLLVQKHGLLGPLNPTLYGLATNPSTYATVFNDITTGSNIVPCFADIPAGTDPGCAGGSASTSGTMGYSALTGYDMVTGLGSINGGALDAALGGGTGKAPTTPSVGANPNPVSLNGKTTLTASVNSTTPGTITGSVTFKVGTATLGSAPVLGGVATMSSIAVVTGNGFSLGSDSITASYGGDANFAASSGSTTLTVTAPPPPPTITSLSPATASAGAAGFTLTVNGTNFVSGATVNWGATALPTTFVSASQVTAAVPANLLAVAGTAGVTVTSAGGTSAAAAFTITATSNFPLVLSMTPGTATAGSAAFTLTVSGANFAPNAKVLWNGAVRSTIYVSSTQLTATIVANDILKEQTARVGVSNPAPNAGSWTGLPFAVMSSNPVASISSASVTVAVNGGNHVLTVTGTDFVPGSTVQWGIGQSLTTSYVSPWQISAVVSASEYNSLSAGVNLTVVNPGGTSAGFELR